MKLYKEINNNTLAVFLLVVILLSLLGTWHSIMRLKGITGAATGLGYINVSINETIGITMVTANINFTSTVPGENKATTKATDITSGPFNITNDGSVTINITIADTETLFDSGSLSRALHYLYNVALTRPANGVFTYPCSLNHTQGLQYTSALLWRAFPASSTETPICALNYTDGYDSVIINVNITVPLDETGGQKSARVTFTSLKSP